MTYRLYHMQSSGNCWKPRAALHQLGHEFDLIDIDIMAGQSRTDDYLAMNPNGRVPLLRLPDGRYLAESNAMLAYLAEGTDLMPADRYGRGVMFQWMFFEQYSHEPYIAVARYWRHLEGKEPPFPGLTHACQLVPASVNGSKEQVEPNPCNDDP